MQTKASKHTSHPGSSHPSPRGQYYRHSGPVAPTSLHQHHSTVWVCPSLLHSPHMRPSLPPERMSPYAALCREMLPGSLKLTGSVCRTPYVKEKSRKVKHCQSCERNETDKFMAIAHADISHTSLFTDLDRHKSNTSSHILEGQVEALLCHRPHLPDLSIEAKNAISKICLCETLICCYGVHLKANNTHFISTVHCCWMVPVAQQRTPRIYLGIVCRPKPCPCREWFTCLQVKEVEGFLAGTRYPRNGVAVSQCETQLHVYLKYRSTNDHKLIRH